MGASFSSDQHDSRIVAGRYELVRKIGTGGMGAVYLARQVNVGNQVAIKFLPAHLVDDTDLRRRFEREALSVSSLQHENIIHIYDFHKLGGAYFIVMEYVEGIDLYDLLDRCGKLRGGRRSLLCPCRNSDQ